MNAVPLDALARDLDAAGIPRTVLAGATPAVLVIAASGAKKGVTEGRSPDGTKYRPLRRPRPDGSSTPLRDKGTLLASIKAAASGTHVTLTASHPGANVHQYGATIVPKVARALAIPLTAEAKRVGSPRRNQFPRPLVRRGSLLTENVGGRLVSHYRLARRVVVPARPYLGFSAETSDRIAAVLQTRALEWVTRQFLADTGPLVESWGISL